MLAEGEGLELSSAEAQQFSGLRPYQLGLTLRKCLAGAAGFEPARTDLESVRLPLPHAPAIELDARRRTRTSEATWTPDLQSGAIAALPPVRKFGIVKNKRARGRMSPFGV